MLGNLLHPGWINFCDTTGVHLTGIDQFSCHDPFAGFFDQTRARVNPKAQLTCAHEVASLVRLQAEVAQQARH